MKIMGESQNDDKNNKAIKFGINAMSQKQRIAYDKGVAAHKAGLPDINQYPKSDLLEYCAFSAGYFDSMKGYV